MNADVSLWGWDVPMKPTKAKRGQPKGNAAPIGSGPKGETCRTCAHSCFIKFAKTYWKCDLVQHTGGPGTDIRLKWAACSRFEKRKEEA